MNSLCDRWGVFSSRALPLSLSAIGNLIKFNSLRLANDGRQDLSRRAWLQKRSGITRFVDRKRRCMYSLSPFASLFIFTCNLTWTNCQVLSLASAIFHSFTLSLSLYDFLHHVEPFFTITWMNWSWLMMPRLITQVLVERGADVVHSQIVSRHWAREAICCTRPYSTMCQFIQQCSLCVSLIASNAFHIDGNTQPTNTISNVFHFWNFPLFWSIASSNESCLVLNFICFIFVVLKFTHLHCVALPNSLDAVVRLIVMTDSDSEINWPLTFQRADSRRVNQARNCLSDEKII
jgi:hypothetical protein